MFSTMPKVWWDSYLNDITTTEKHILSVLYILHKKSIPPVFIVSILGFLNRKYKDQRLVIYFYKKYFNIEIGRYTYGVIQLLNSEYHTLKSIGNFCAIARNLVLAGYDHPIHRFTTHPITTERKYGFIEKELAEEYLQESNLITIGNDVWIGSNVIILPPVNISTGAVIGAGAVVTKDVPPYAVVVGVPAKVIKYRFSQKTIDMLLKSEWWNMEDSKICEICSILYHKENKMDSDYEGAIQKCFSTL